MAATPSSTLWRIADDRLDGRLADRLAELRADERSWRWIGRRLAPEVGFVISHETLRSWGAVLGIPDPEPTEAKSA